MLTNRGSATRECDGIYRRKRLPIVTPHLGGSGQPTILSFNTVAKHKPRLSCHGFADDGFTTGQAIGQTERLGGYTEERPVPFPSLNNRPH